MRCLEKNGILGLNIVTSGVYEGFKRVQSVFPMLIDDLIVTCGGIVLGAPKCRENQDKKNAEA